MFLGLLLFASVCVCLFVCKFYMTKCLFVVLCECVVAEFYL